MPGLTFRRLDMISLYSFRLDPSFWVRICRQAQRLRAFHVRVVREFRSRHWGPRSAERLHAFKDCERWSLQSIHSKRHFCCCIGKFWGRCRKWLVIGIFYFLREFRKIVLDPSDSPYGGFLIPFLTTGCLPLHIALVFASALRLCRRLHNLVLDSCRVLVINPCWNDEQEFHSYHLGGLGAGGCNDIGIASRVDTSFNGAMR